MKAFKDYGWLLAIIVAIAAFMFAAYVFNPVKTVEEEVAEPAAVALGIVPGVCPDGWKDASERDEHGRVKACFSGDPNTPKPGEWLVIFDKEGQFEHAIQIDTPSSIPVTDSSKVPGWPK